MRSALKALLPSRLRFDVEEGLALEPQPRRVYFRRLARRVLVGDPAPPTLAPEPGEVLFICHGNIIRSALAEALFARALAARSALPEGRSSGPNRGRPAGWRSASAGLHATDGHPADPRAVSSGLLLGADLADHRARTLTEQAAREASLIVVMDRRNEAELLHRHPWALGKVALLGTLGGDSDPLTGSVIADPYSRGERDVERTALRIDRSVRDLAARLLDGASAR